MTTSIDLYTTAQADTLLGAKADKAAFDDPDSDVRTTLDSVYMGRLTPSGDDSGATDGPRIQALLDRGGEILLSGGDYYIDSALSIGDDTTLVLWDATLNLAAGSNCNVIVNKDQTTVAGNSGIRIKGIGRAIINGNAAGQTRQDNLWENIGLLFVTVDGLTVEDVEIGPTNAYAACMQGVTAAKWSRIRLSQDGSGPNQDGIDVGPACSDITIEHITGQTGDDTISVFAYAGARAIVPLYQTGAGDIADVKITNVKTIAGVMAGGSLRMQAGDGRTLKHVKVNGLANLNPAPAHGAVVQIESRAVVQPNPEDLSDIELNNVSGGTATSTKTVVAIDTSCQDISVDGVRVENQCSSILGTGHDTTDSAFTARRVSVRNITSPDFGAAVAGLALMHARAGAWDHVTIESADLGGIASILANNATVTNLKIGNIHIGTMYGTAFASSVAETGTIADVVIDSYASGVAQRWSYAMALRMSGIMPALTSADVVPAATALSRITTDGSITPGTTAATGNTYVADGTRWSPADPAPTTPVGGSVNILPSSVPVASAPTSLAQVPTSWYGLERKFTASPAAAGSYMSWQVYLSAGTYSITALLDSRAVNGIITISIDGTDLSPTIDSYASTGAALPETRIDNVAIVTTGWHTVKLTAAAKNASTNTYGISMSSLALSRTA